jgi:hypothetical protein
LNPSRKRGGRGDRKGLDMKEEQRETFSATCPKGHVTWQTFSPRQVRELGGDLKYWCPDCNGGWKPTHQQRQNLLKHLEERVTEPERLDD